MIQQHPEWHSPTRYATEVAMAKVQQQVALTFISYQGDSSSHDAHDESIVNWHANVLRVIQRRYRHVTCLPGQERSEHLEAKLDEIPFATTDIFRTKKGFRTLL